MNLDYEELVRRFQAVYGVSRHQAEQMIGYHLHGGCIKGDPTHDPPGLPREIRDYQPDGQGPATGPDEA